jgi:hypothetical protein
LYYKHVTIVDDDSRVLSKGSFKLIGDPRVIIYDCHRFIIQAKGLMAIDTRQKILYKEFANLPKVSHCGLASIS